MDQITVKNFRCFREEQTVRLAPLTVLVGENSTGKTSLMAMIRALWEVAYSRSEPNFKREPYDLGSFDDIVHHRGGRGIRASSIEAGFMTPARMRSTKFHKYEVAFEKRGTVPSLCRIRLSIEGAWIKASLENQTWQISFGTTNGAWKINRKEDRYDRLAADIRPVLPSDFFFVLRMIDIDRKSDFEGFEALNGSEPPSKEDLRRIRQLVLTRNNRRYVGYPEAPTLYASAPVRSKPHRTYDPAITSRDPEGDYIPMYFADTYSQNKKEWDNLKEALEQFGQTSGLFDEITVKPLGGKGKEGGPFQVQIRKAGKKTKGPYRNLLDVGYGVSQILPVITELLRQDIPPMVLLQQPEVHLHPSAQAALGSLLCQVTSRRKDLQIVVETHSDNLLDRIRMDIRDQKTSLKPDDVSVLFFEPGDLDVQIHSLRLDKQGNVLDAPPNYRSFFLQETKRTLGQ